MRGAVAPRPIADGTYPLSRSLYIYVNNGRRRAARGRGFVDFYLSDEGIDRSVDGGRLHRAADGPDRGHAGRPGSRSRVTDASSIDRGPDGDRPSGPSSRPTRETGKVAGTMATTMA